MRAAGSPFIVVLGHLEYYPRFGFEPASKYHLTCEFNVPDEMFMVLILDKKVASLAGVAKYHQEFDVWR